MKTLGFSTVKYNLAITYAFFESFSRGSDEEGEEEDYDSNQHDCNQVVHDGAAADNSFGNINDDASEDDSYDKKKKERTNPSALFGTVPKKRKGPIVLGIGHKAPASSCFESSASSSSSSVHSGAGPSWDQEIEHEDDSEDERVLEQIKIRKAAIHKNKKKLCPPCLPCPFRVKKGVPTVVVVS